MVPSTLCNRGNVCANDWNRRPCCVPVVTDPKDSEIMEPPSDGSMQICETDEKCSRQLLNDRQTHEAATLARSGRGRFVGHPSTLSRFHSTILKWCDGSIAVPSVPFEHHHRRSSRQKCDRRSNRADQRPIRFERVATTSHRSQPRKAKERRLGCGPSEGSCHSPGRGM